VGLTNADNTSDLNKPISTATQTALNAKQAVLVSGTNIKTVNGVSVIGAGNVPVGTVTDTALNVTAVAGADITSSVTTSTTTPVITLNIPDASATARGVVTTGVQTFTGNKTVSNNLSVGGSLTVTNTFNANAGINNVGTGTGNTTTTIGGGATLSGNTKTVNIGTAGVAGSTTNVNIGSPNGVNNIILNAGPTIRGANTRIESANTSAILRHDGGNFWILKTAVADPSGGYDATRPLQIDMTTGNQILGSSTPLTTLNAAATSITGTLDLNANIIPVANGGTNSSTALSGNRMMRSTAGGRIIEAGELTDGKLFIGRTGNIPLNASLTAGNNVSIAEGPGSITVNADLTYFRSVVTANLISTDNTGVAVNTITSVPIGTYLAVFSGNFKHGSAPGSWFIWMEGTGIVAADNTRQFSAIEAGWYQGCYIMGVVTLTAVTNVTVKFKLYIGTPGTVTHDISEFNLIRLV
jgi:hypothetical protein